MVHRDTLFPVGPELSQQPMEPGALGGSLTVLADTVSTETDNFDTAQLTTSRAGNRATELSSYHRSPSGLTAQSAASDSEILNTLNADEQRALMRTLHLHSLPETLVVRSTLLDTAEERPFNQMGARVTTDPDREQRFEGINHDIFERVVEVDFVADTNFLEARPGDTSDYGPIKESFGEFVHHITDAFPNISVTCRIHSGDSISAEIIRECGFVSFDTVTQEMFEDDAHTPFITYMFVDPGMTEADEVFDLPTRVHEINRRVAMLTGGGAAPDHHKRIVELATQQLHERAGYEHTLATQESHADTFILGQDPEPGLDTRSALRKAYPEWHAISQRQKHGETGANHANSEPGRQVASVQSTGDVLDWDVVGDHELTRGVWHDVRKGAAFLLKTCANTLGTAKEKHARIDDLMANVYNALLKGNPYVTIGRFDSNEHTEADKEVIRNNVQFLEKLYRYYASGWMDVPQFNPDLLSFNIDFGADRPTQGILGTLLDGTRLGAKLRDTDIRKRNLRLYIRPAVFEEPKKGKEVTSLESSIGDLSYPAVIVSRMELENWDEGVLLRFASALSKQIPGHLRARSARKHRKGVMHWARKSESPLANAILKIRNTSEEIG